jgi:hypothetical protein
MLKLIQDIERQKSDSNFLEGRKIEDFYDFKEAIEQVDDDDDDWVDPEEFNKDIQELISSQILKSNEPLFNQKSEFQSKTNLKKLSTLIKGDIYNCAVCSA